MTKKTPANALNIPPTALATCSHGTLCPFKVQFAVDVTTGSALLPTASWL